LTTQGFDSAPPLQDTGLVLTDGNNFEARSAWWNVKQGVQSFTTTYQLWVSPNNNVADGCTFTVQNDLQGNAARGANGSGLGYVGIQNSVAVFFNLYPGVSQIGQYVNGTRTDSVDLSGSGINLHAGATYDVSLTYDGSNISAAVTDDANPIITFSTTFSTVYIPGVVQGTTAYVGFTGGTGGATSIQDILSWSYVDPPAPAAGALPTDGAQALHPGLEGVPLLGADVPTENAVSVLLISLSLVPDGPTTPLFASLPDRRSPAHQSDEEVRVYHETEKDESTKEKDGDMGYELDAWSGRTF
jgi:hypothetical protein